MTKQEFEERKKELERRSEEVHADFERTLRRLEEHVQEMKRILRRSA